MLDRTERDRERVHELVTALRDLITRAAVVEAAVVSVRPGEMKVAMHCFCVLFDFAF